MEFEFFAWHISITLKDDPLSQFKRKSERCQPHLLVNWAGMTLKKTMRISDPVSVVNFALISVDEV